MQDEQNILIMFHLFIIILYNINNFIILNNKKEMKNKSW
jgi:hypothetical protein